MNAFLWAQRLVLDKFSSVSVLKKLVLVFIFSLSFSLVFIAALVFYYDVSFLKPNLVRQVSTVSAILKTQLFAPLIFDRQEEALRYLQLLSTLPDISGAALYDANKVIFSEYLFNAPPFDQLPIIEGTFIENKTLHYTTSLQYSGRTIGYLYIMMGLPSLLDQVLFYDQAIFLLLVGFLLLSLTFYILLKWVLLKPIVALTEMVGFITSSRNYRLRLRGYRKDELGVLSRSFNSMLDVIESHAESLMVIAQSLAYEKELAEVTLACIQEGVVVVNTQGQVTFLNGKAEKLTGFYAKEALDQSLETVLRLYTPERGVFTVALMHDVLVSRQTMEVPAHCFLLQRSSAHMAVEATFSPIERGFNQVMGVVIIFRDVSQKREREKILTQQATHDRLTNLPNRFLFESQVYQWILSVKPINIQKQIAILFLDLDGFKAVNDSLGHDVGDLLLVKVSERLKHCIRSVDIVCRQGGDEFVIAISKVDSSQLVSSIAENIMAQLKHPFVLQHQSVKVGVSIGIALFPLDGKEVSELIKKADIAMYEAKSRGRNQCLFYHKVIDESFNNQSSHKPQRKFVSDWLKNENKKQGEVSDQVTTESC